jgi:hypothetical protein
MRREKHRQKLCKSESGFSAIGYSFVPFLCKCVVLYVEEYHEPSPPPSPSHTTNEYLKIPNILRESVKD